MSQEFVTAEPLVAEKKIYDTDKDGNEVYATDSEGNQILKSRYAMRNRRFYYPKDRLGIDFPLRNSNNLPIFIMHENQMVMLKDAKGGELYIPSKDGSRQIFPATDKTPGRYLINSEGDEYYPKILKGKHAGKEILLETGKYARRKNGVQYYPTNEHGDEYGPEHSMHYIIKEKRIVYPVRKNGDVIYPTLSNGDEVYAKHLNRYHIAFDKSGKERYARKSNGDEFYPLRLVLARKPRTYKKFLFPDTIPFYATKKNGDVVFPISNGSEMYIQDKGSDIIEGVTRYALDVHKNEKYPKTANEDGRLYQHLLQNRYASKKTGEPYYPEDIYRNEYYVEWKPLLREGDVILDRYALTNDDYYILPDREGSVYISKNLLPSMNERNVVGLLDRGFPKHDSYLTNVKSVETLGRNIHKWAYTSRPIMKKSSNQKWYVWPLILILLTVLWYSVILWYVMTRTSPLHPGV